MIRNIHFYERRKINKNLLFTISTIIFKLDFIQSISHVSIQLMKAFGILIKINLSCNLHLCLRSIKRLWYEMKNSIAILNIKYWNSQQKKTLCCQLLGNKYFFYCKEFSILRYSFLFFLLIFAKKNNLIYSDEKHLNFFGTRRQRNSFGNWFYGTHWDYGFSMKIL